METHKQRVHEEVRILDALQHGHRELAAYARRLFRTRSRYANATRGFTPSRVIRGTIGVACPRYAKLNTCMSKVFISPSA